MNSSMPENNSMPEVNLLSKVHNFQNERGIYYTSHSYNRANFLSTAWLTCSLTKLCLLVIASSNNDYDIPSGPLSLQFTGKTNHNMISLQVLALDKKESLF